MYLSKNMFGFALLASVLSVGSSFAQQVVNFHLPVPVKWGNSILEPGGYRMEVPISSVGVQSVCMKNAKRSAFAFPLAMSSTLPKTLSDNSYLQLVNVNGTYFVRKYTSGMTGQTLLFGIPKVHNTSIAQNTNTTDIEGSN